jgi:predicted Zn-dependent peptidase
MPPPPLPVVPTPVTPPPPEKPMPPAAPTQTAAPQALVFPDEAFRGKQPEPGAVRPFTFPKVKTFALKNGLKVFLVEQHVLPIVSMDLNIDGGGLADGKGKDGMASVCMSMLTEGTDKLDKIAYSEALADIASSVNAYAADDSHGLTLSSLTKHLDETFALFADTLRTPGMRQTDFDRMIKRRIEGVKQQKGSPASLAQRVTAAVLYGPEHPFGGVTTEEGLSKITLDDCKHFVGTWLKPQGARLFVVGDQTEAQLRARFDGSPALAKWTGSAPKAPALPAPKTLKGRIFFVNVPGAAQSQVSLLHFGPKRTAAGYFATSIMGSVFGGGFASRINMNLREEKGYSYGARGGFSYSHNYGVFTAAAGVQANSTYQTVLEIDKEINNLASGKKPVTDEELAREKLGATLALPGRFATAQAALGQYRGLVYFGLPLDYYDTYAAKIEKLTSADVAAAAKKELHPSEAIYVVVGDGDAPMIHVEGDKNDAELMKDGKRVTLRQALADLAANGNVGKGGLVELDSDGRVVH